MSARTYSRHLYHPQRQCPCVVPHCAKRTTRGRDDGSVWFCSTHWKAVPKRWRVAYRRVSRSDNEALYQRMLARLIDFSIEASLADPKIKFEWSSV